MHEQFSIEEPIVESFEDCFSDFDEADLEQVFTGSLEKYLDDEDEDFMSSFADEELDPPRDTHGAFYRFRFQIFASQNFQNKCSYSHIACANSLEMDVQNFDAVRPWRS